MKQNSYGVAIGLFRAEGSEGHFPSTASKKSLYKIQENKAQEVMLSFY